MRLKEISENLFYVGFNKRERMGDTFMRFHGHYENPNFHEKIFTQKQFERWFKFNTEEGIDLDSKFSKIAGGFDIPGYIFSPFLRGKFNPLSKEEKGLLKEISKINRDDFFVISSLFKEKELFRHEVAHGLFYLNEDYKREIIDFIGNINKKDYAEFEKKIKGQQIYADFKILDEMQAKLIVNYYGLLSNDYSNEKRLLKYHKKINLIFDKYWEGSKLI